MSWLKVDYFTNLTIEQRKNVFGIFLVIPALIFFGIFVAYPAIRSIQISLSSWPGFGEARFIGIRNYVQLFHDPVFWTALKNNVIFVIATTVLQTVIPMVLATLLYKSRFLSTFFRTSFFVPYIISFIVSGTLWSLIFEPNFGFLNSLLANLGLGSLEQLWLASPFWALPCIIVVSLWRSLGFYMVIFFAGLQRIPEGLYESARISGANTFQQFLYITIPLLRPVLLVVIVINIIGGFKVFGLVWAMTTGGPNHASEVMATYLYTTAFGAVGTGSPQMGYAAAVGIMILLTALVASIAQLRIGGVSDLEY